MGRLTYSAICSLDGCTADASGGFDWAAPDAEVHAFVNEQERDTGTYLYGRRMYETMRVWQELPATPDEAPEVVAYADVWRAADKVVYSTSLDEVSTPRTVLSHAFEPAEVAEQVRAGARETSIGGPTLAAHALRAGIVDELRLYVVPIVVGGGTRALPDGVRLELRLDEQHRFANGTVFLRYLTTPAR